MQRERRAFLLSAEVSRPVLGAEAFGRGWFGGGRVSGSAGRYSCLMRLPDPLRGPEPPAEAGSEVGVSAGA